MDDVMNKKHPFPLLTECRLRVAIPSALLPAALALVLMAASCSAAGKNNTTQKGAPYQGDTGKALESADRIDREKTYEIYFRLTTPEECIRVEMTSRAPESAIEKKVRVIRTFFIVEKSVDLSKFDVRNAARTVFSEIGRNYDQNWNRTKEITLCSTPSDPIRKMDPSLYRIRFTSFRDDPFSFEIIIYSKNSAVFSEKPAPR